MCCLPLSVANSPSFSAFNPASSYKVHIIGEDRHDEGPHRQAIGEDRHDEGAGCILMQRKQKERNSSIPVISIQLFCTPTQQTIKNQEWKKLSSIRYSHASSAIGM